MKAVVFVINPEGNHHVWYKLTWFSVTLPRQKGRLWSFPQSVNISETGLYRNQKHDRLSCFFIAKTVVAISRFFYALL